MCSKLSWRFICFIGCSKIAKSLVGTCWRRRTFLDYKSSEHLLQSLLDLFVLLLKQDRHRGFLLEAPFALLLLSSSLLFLLLRPLLPPQVSTLICMSLSWRVQQYLIYLLKNESPFFGNKISFLLLVVHYWLILIKSAGGVGRRCFLTSDSSNQNQK
jgi:hypothetical protein